MSFNLSEPSTFINIKLTDAGRRQLSLGRLKFSKAIFSDREVNYNIDRTGFYSISANRVISPKDFHPSISLNLDGSNAFDLGESQVIAAKQFATATTETAGFMTGSTFAWSIELAKAKGYNSMTYAYAKPSGGTTVTLNNSLGTYLPATGDLVYIPWQPTQNSGTTPALATILSANPTNALWYKVVGRTGNTMSVDRNTPNFVSSGGVTTGTTVLPVYFYPDNAIETYYGSASTQNTQVWNMNIVRTGAYPGSPTSISGDSAYKAFGSIEYAGAKHYFGFGDSLPAVGIIHFTNEYTANTYAEQFVEKTFSINLPTIMWHKDSQTNGQALTYGVTLYDADGDTTFDGIAQTTYRPLKDGISSTSNEVGRVYHKLKMAVITDQELLAAMTYKSNRSYTLPQLDLTFTRNPKYPLTTSVASGFTKTDYEYYVTYLVESFSAYSHDRSFGYGPVLPCMSISKIAGANDANGNPQYLSASFPSQSFPYLRSAGNMSGTSAYSGTGWNCNKVQLLVSEQLVEDGYQVGTVPVNSWTAVSTTVGNGIYTGDTTDSSIDPLKLAGYQFVISHQDLLTGATYTLDSLFYQNQTTLNFGDECFLFGTLDVDILSTTYKSVITAYAKNDELNSSTNDTFDDLVDEDVYITEIAIIDDSANVVAVGKPTYPIKKSEGRFLAFQLEIDF